jgi:predicted nucleic acid-binding Zn ribbon protein
MQEKSEDAKFVSDEVWRESSMETFRQHQRLQRQNDLKNLGGAMSFGSISSTAVVSRSRLTEDASTVVKAWI